MKYDDVSWHTGGDFPEDLPEEAGATHIGMFMAWAILRGLVSEFHERESAAELRQVRNREITGRNFVLKMCDGKLTDEDLNAEGNLFAAKYLEDNYTDDYLKVLPENLETIYHAEDSWEIFDKLTPLVDARLETWRQSDRQ